MYVAAFLASDIFAWVVLPVLIFLARIVDVSMGTIRLLFISKGYRRYATILGFFEVLIWIMAIGQIMKNLNNWVCYFAYAGGFAAGTYVGLSLDERLSIGRVVVRVVTSKDATELLDYLRSADYGVTSIDAEGSTGPVKVILTIIERKDLAKVLEAVKRFNPNAFYTISDIRSVSREGGIFPSRTTKSGLPVPPSRPHRKGK